MTKKSDFRRGRWRNMLLAAAAVAATAAPAFSQDANVAKPYTEGEYYKWDVGAYFGTQWFQLWQGTAGRSHDFLARPVVGVRYSQNIGRHFGFEESFNVGFNKLALLPANGSAYATVGERNYTISFLGLAYLTPRDHKYRPYLEAGPSEVIYSPDGAGEIKQPASGIRATIPAQLRTKVEPGFTYGIGIKMPLTHRIGVHIDLRGMWTPTPSFGLPSTPGLPGSLYMEQHHGENALMFTSGLEWRHGFVEPPPPPAPPPPPPPPPPPAVANLAVGMITGAHDVCPGDNITLNVNASGWLPDQTPAYQWFVNDQPAPGGNGASFNLSTTTGNGAQRVKVTVTAGAVNKTSDTVSVTIKSLAPPTIRFALSQSTINYGDRLPLNAQATGSDCGGQVTVRYTASEGTIAGNTFDSSGVSFDNSNPAEQRKVVHITATATDQKNQTANAAGDVTVVKKATTSRQDVVFPSRSSRVNNAAKRYLIEQLTPKLKADPGSTVILVGHRDPSEGRMPNLDRDRVLNAAAVLSAGKGVCPSLDLSRIQVAYAGTDQTNPPMPFGDASVKERRGSAATDDKSQFRRVEVYFVPSGATAPSIPGLMPAPDKLIKAKGCPR